MGRSFWISLQTKAARHCTWTAHGTKQEGLLNTLFPSNEDGVKKFLPLEGRPAWPDPTSPTKTNWQLKLLSITDVDEKAATVELMLWIRIQWRDPRLQWHPSDHGGVTVVQPKSSALWTPDFFMYEMLEQTI